MGPATLPLGSRLHLHLSWIWSVDIYQKKEGWEWGQGKWSSWKYESDNSFEVATMMMMAHQTGGSPTLAWLLRRRWTRLRIFEQTSSFSESLKVNTDDWGIEEQNKNSFIQLLSRCQATFLKILRPLLEFCDCSKSNKTFPQRRSKM